MRHFILLSVSFFFLLPLWSQQNHFPPRDETKKDPSLYAFVGNLKKAIDNKDNKWIMNALDDEVESGLDTEGGKKDFNAIWNVESDSSDFWTIMTRIVNMGGVFLHDTADWTGRYQFVFPYIYDINLNIEDDYYNMGLITGTNVNIRAQPDIKAKVVAQLSYDLIIFRANEAEGMQITSGSNGMGEPEWYNIETYGKDKTGWVNWRFVYNLMGPRLFLYKHQTSGWKISALLTGD